MGSWRTVGDLETTQMDGNGLGWARMHGCRGRSPCADGGQDEDRRLAPWCSSMGSFNKGISSGTEEAWLRWARLGGGKEGDVVAMGLARRKEELGLMRRVGDAAARGGTSMTDDDKRNGETAWARSEEEEAMQRRERDREKPVEVPEDREEAKSKPVVAAAAGQEEEDGGEVAAVVGARSTWIQEEETAAVCERVAAALA